MRKSKSEEISSLGVQQFEITDLTGTLDKFQAIDFNSVSSFLVLIGDILKVFFCNDAFTYNSFQKYVTLFSKTL